MTQSKKVRFKVPRIIKHRETKEVMNGLIEVLGDRLGVEDFASLHRMATAYDIYLTCAEIIAQEGPVMQNIKGELVKRPEANLMKENWSQFFDLAKEYGLTIKAKAAMKMDESTEDSPLLQFIKEIRGVH